MNKTRIMEKVYAIIPPAYVALVVGLGVFFGVLFAGILRLASLRDDSGVDISDARLLQAQESPKSSAIRLNAAWLRERSQV